MSILAVSGSLRAQSTNTSLLRAAALVAAPELEIVVYGDLESIPPFHPDREAADGVPSVLRWRKALRESQAVLFSTPEYARGIPGALKNALDRVVGSGELSGKPVALINASARATYAQAALQEVLRAMDARLVDGAEVTIARLNRSATPSEMVGEPEIAYALRGSLQALAMKL